MLFLRQIEDDLVEKGKLSENESFDVRDYETDNNMQNFYSTLYELKKVSTFLEISSDLHFLMLTGMLFSQKQLSPYAPPCIRRTVIIIIIIIKHIY